MLVWTFVFAAYSLVTLFAVYMTYQEQERLTHPNMLLRMTGYLACVAWPLVFAAIFVEARRQPAQLTRAELD